MSDGRRDRQSAEQSTVPAWWIERLAAGDLPFEQTLRIRERLQNVGELERLRGLEASNRAILDAHPPADVGREVRRRLAAAPEMAAAARAPRPWRALGLGAAAVALLSLPFVGTQLGVEPAPIVSHDETNVRLEGLAPELVIYKKTAAGAVRLANPARAQAGDVVQLAYVAAGRRYGVVASIDSTNAVTLHLPEAPGAAAALVPQSETPLAHAFELDDAPGAERFVFVTADRPFDVAAVIAALRDGATLPLGLSVNQLQLEKKSHE